MISADALTGKNVLLRADLDVPVEQGKGLPAGRRVISDFRLQAILPTIRFCLEHAKSTLIIGHLGRPEGSDPNLSLKPIKEWLERALNQPILFIDSGFSPGEWAREVHPLAMFDNLRFHLGELSSDREFAKQLSSGSDIYIYEAFAAYNTAASLQRIPELLPTYPGFRFSLEVENLEQIVKSPARPSLLIISGAKNDKRKFVDKLASKFDEVLLGGKFATGLTPDGLDIDEETITLFSEKIKTAKSVVLNGPLGYFEDGVHAVGTRAILQALKDSLAFSLLGGGDTLSAISALGFSYSDFSFVSTGGGAMLEFLATGTHPLLEIIKKQSHASS